MIYHILIMPPVIGRRGCIFLTCAHRFRTVLYEKSHAFAAALLPVPIMSFKGECDHQLNLTIFWLFFESEQNFTGPHVHAQGAAHPELAESLLIKSDQLVPDALLNPFAAIIVFIIFKSKSRWSMAGNCTSRCSYHIHSPI